MAKDWTDGRSPAQNRRLSRIPEDKREELSSGIASLGRTAAEFTPGLGDALTAQEAYGEAREGNYGTAALLAALAAIGLVPTVGDAVSAAGRAAIKRATPEELLGDWYHSSSNYRRKYSDFTEEERRRLSSEGIEEFKPSSWHGNAVYISPDPTFAEASQLYYPNNQRIDLVGRDTVLNSNIATYPLRVKAAKYFDYENPEHVAAVAARLPYPDNEHFVRRLAENNLSNWGDIESKSSLLKSLGFEGMYIKEAGRKNLGVFNPANLKSRISAPPNPDWTNKNISKASGGMVSTPTEMPSNYSKGRWRLI